MTPLRRPKDRHRPSFARPARAHTLTAVGSPREATTATQAGKSAHVAAVEVKERQRKLPPDLDPGGALTEKRLRMVEHFPLGQPVVVFYFHVLVAEARVCCQVVAQLFLRRTGAKEHDLVVSLKLVPELFPVMLQVGALGIMDSGFGTTAVALRSTYTVLHGHGTVERTVRRGKELRVLVIEPNGYEFFGLGVLHNIANVCPDASRRH